MNKSIRRALLAGTCILAGSVAPVFAQLTSGGVQAPPNYNTFVPPLAGGTYVDPVFGSTVKRVTNAILTPNIDRGGMLQWITDEYATMSPFNNDNSKFILVHQSYFGLYDGAGFFIRELPLEINASSEPRWSRKDNHTLYYIHVNQLKSYDITSGTTAILHTFSEYSTITGKGESDISVDGDHFVFAGDGRYVFTFQISTGAKSAVFDTGGHSFDSLYITPKNNVTITWNQSGTVRYSGIEFFDGNMNFQRQVAHAGGHMDVASDNGNEVLVWTNSADPQPICDNGIVKINLANGQQTCIATFDWSLAVHISAPDNAGFVYVETYAPANPSTTSGWVPYTNELLQVKMDGSQVARLAHHRSRPTSTDTYNWQPRMSTSHDGTRIVYNSDYDLQVINGYVGDYSDVYLILVGGIATPTTTTPPPATTPPPTTTPADPAPPAPTPAPTTSSTVRHEQTDSAVQKAGTWYPNNGAFNSGGSSILGMEASSKVTFTFTGTGATWIGYKDQWSGIAKVYVDGALKGTIDTYSATTSAQASLYSVSGLTNASHTIAVAVTGTKNNKSGGAWVWVDAFDVAVATSTSSTPPASTPPATPPASSATPARIQQNGSGVATSGGTWYTNNGAFNSGGSSILSMDPGARTTLTFTGTAVKWIAYRDEWSGIAKVYVDGALVATVDTYATPSQAQATAYTASGLSSGTHTLAIEVTGTRSAASGGNWVWVDAFDVTP